MMAQLAALGGLLLAGDAAAVHAEPPRDAFGRGGRFVNATGGAEHLTGANVVVKGAPWLPSRHFLNASTARRQKRHNVTVSASASTPTRRS